MEPELPTPRLNPERGPAPVEQGREILPSFSPEVEPGANERQEQRSEDAARAAETQAISLPTVAPTPVIGDDSTVADDNSLLVDDTPAIAADEDLIEKEWVDKAKQIISQTKNDPHQREQEIARLQVEYLRKRYGKELDTSNR